jgi:hypothetical protein
VRRIVKYVFQCSLSGNEHATKAVRVPGCASSLVATVPCGRPIPRGGRRILGQETGQ